MVELLVVVAIIAVLVSILLPVLRGMRERAQRAVCLGNVRLQGTTYLTYAAETGGTLPFKDKNEFQTIRPAIRDRFFDEQGVEGFVCPGFGPSRGAVPSDRLANKTTEQLAAAGGGYFATVPAHRKANDGLHYWLTYAHWTAFDDGWWSSSKTRCWADFRLSKGKRAPSSAFSWGPLMSDVPRTEWLIPTSTLVCEFYPDDRVDNFGHPPGVSFAGRGGVTRHCDEGIVPAGGNVLLVDGSAQWGERLVQARSLWHAVYWAVPDDAGPRNPVG